ncbi:MAG TPA: hypothetical protein DDW23_07210 [Planctomycetes bacterium]|nr:hypothetical protein [Planctomycetota bacterium]
MQPIASKDNDRLKEIRALRAGKGDKDVCLVEGPRLFTEALDAGVDVQWALYDPEDQKLAPLLDRASSSGVTLCPCKASLLREVSDVDSPRGFIAVASRPTSDLAPMGGTKGLIVVSAGIQDPRNLGAIIRSAAGLGANGVVTLKGGVSAWHPRSVRGSAGMVFRVPVLDGILPEEFFALAESQGLEILATGTAGIPLHKVESRGPLALLLGEEGGGLDSVLRERCSQTIAIPLRRGVESLNVGAAAAVLVHALAPPPI